MEKQKYSKPYAARFLFYRWRKGGVWRKYEYNMMGRRGWYWTKDDLACGGDPYNGGSLEKVKEVSYN